MTAIDTPGTGLTPYAAPQVEEYRARIMTPEDAKALDERVRACTRAVLREGTDYGIIPGTNGEQTLWRPGAQKLLQWFGFSVSCERVEVERDDDGRKHGITYRATVTRRLPDGSLDTLATCEGTADYDESKFYQSAEQVRDRLRDQEHKWAKKDHRPPNADRWNSAKEYRADWNALMKRAQKRAIVGATVDATAAGGIFSDQEEDDHRPAPPDDVPSLGAQLLAEAAGFETEAAAQRIWRESAAAAHEGLCTPGAATHIQNRIRLRLKTLQQAAQPVDVGDLASQAAQDASPAGSASSPPGARRSAAGQPADEPAGEAHDPGPAVPDDATGSDSAAGLGSTQAGEPDHYHPGTHHPAQLKAIWTILTGAYGFAGDEADKTRARAVCAHIAGRPLTSTKDLSYNEARKVLDTLGEWRAKADQQEITPREYLNEAMTAGEGDGDE